MSSSSSRKNRRKATKIAVQATLRFRVVKEDGTKSKSTKEADLPEFLVELDAESVASQDSSSSSVASQSSKNKKVAAAIKKQVENAITGGDEQPLLECSIKAVAADDEKSVK